MVGCNAMRSRWNCTRKGRTSHHVGVDARNKDCVHVLGLDGVHLCAIHLPMLPNTMDIRMYFQSLPSMPFPSKLVFFPMHIQSHLLPHTYFKPHLAHRRWDPVDLIRLRAGISHRRTVFTNETRANVPWLVLPCDPPTLPSPPHPRIRPSSFGCGPYPIRISQSYGRGSTTSVSSTVAGKAQANTAERP